MNPATRTQATALAELLSDEQDTQTLWAPGDLAAIWKHQLSAAVNFDLGGLNQTQTELLRVENTSPGDASFADFLRDSKPPLQGLELIKQFAKAHLHHPQSPLPHEIATALYHTAIVVALLRCGKRITTLKKKELRHGIENALAKQWLDETTRATLREGLESSAL